MMPEGWKKYRLDDLAERITSGGTPLTTRSDYYGGTIPWLKTQEINFNRIYDTETYISEVGLENSSAKWISENSVIVAMYGATAGKVALSKIPLTTNQACCNITLNPRLADYHFIYYNLLSRYSEILRMATGAAQQNLNSGMIKDLLIILPDLQEQSRIASILSSLDDKIELNLQMNKTLEAIAQAVFKEWFVDFQFPGFNEELVEGLPKGWRKTSLGVICKRITKGTTPTTLKKDYVDNGINFIKVESIDECGNFITDKFAFIDEETNKMLKRSIIEENDILFTIAGTIGRVAKADKSVLPANTNQAVSIIRIDDTKYIDFIYLSLKSEIFMNLIQSKAVHAVQANISLGVISDSEVVIPDNNILHNFNRIINSILNKITANTYEVRTLKSIRDSLLTKLMTGKIKVA